MSGANKRAPIHVVAGILEGVGGTVLLAQRPPGKHLAGAWEFPGGKLEKNESPLAGLARELNEELGVTVDAAHPLMRLVHAYPERTIDLDAWLITRYRGKPRPLDGQNLRWCERAALTHEDLLPADRPIVTALRLPQRLVVGAGTGYRVVEIVDLKLGRDGSSLCGALCDQPRDAARALAKGAEFLVMRGPLEKRKIAALCAGINIPVFVYGITLPEAWALGATGVSDIEG